MGATPLFIVIISSSSLMKNNNTPHIVQQTKYAKDMQTGTLVHIKNVAKGLQCNCVCAACGERMIANKGEHNQHYFSHERRARLHSDYEQCFISTMHFLAERIIMRRKAVMLPSYFNAMPATRIRFATVEIEERNDRSDLQPDIVGVTAEGERYLIEIKYSHAVDNKKRTKIVTDNLTCLEIDISKQDMDTLEDFLLNKSEGRCWLNNRFAFERVEQYWRDRGYNVHYEPSLKCKGCNYVLTENSSCKPIEISHQNHTYVLCKSTNGCIKSNAKKKAQDTARSRSSSPSNKSKFTNTSKNAKSNGCGNWRNLRGTKNNFPLMPDQGGSTIEEYFKNIAIHKIFYRNGSSEGTIINAFKGKDKFGVVLSSNVNNRFYSFIVSMDADSRFLYKWRGPYDDEMEATLGITWYLNK